MPPPHPSQLFCDREPNPRPMSHYTLEAKKMPVQLTRIRNKTKENYSSKIVWFSGSFDDLNSHITLFARIEESHPSTTTPGILAVNLND